MLEVFPSIIFVSFSVYLFSLFLFHLVPVSLFHCDISSSLFLFSFYTPFLPSFYFSLLSLFLSFHLLLSFPLHFSFLFLIYSSLSFSSPIGVSCPRAGSYSDKQKLPAEPYGQEAMMYTKELIMQREVDVEVESCDKGGNFIGWMFVDGHNLAVSLLEVCIYI